jgi:hypothetical protein
MSQWEEKGEESVGMAQEESANGWGEGRSLSGSGLKNIS